MRANGVMMTECGAMLNPQELHHDCPVLLHVALAVDLHGSSTDSARVEYSSVNLQDPIVKDVKS